MSRTHHVKGVSIHRESADTRRLLHRRARARLRGWLWRTMRDLPTAPDPRERRTQGWVSW